MVSSYDQTLESIPHVDGSAEVVGIVYGNVGSLSLRCTVTEPLEKNEYVQIFHETCGFVLGQVDEIERKTDLSIEKAQQISEGHNIEIEEKVVAVISMIGFRDDRNLLQVPHTPFRAGEVVCRAKEDLICDVIGLNKDERKGAYLGLLGGHNVPILVDINSLVQRHVSILAKTGGGKSYAAGVLIEEFMKHDVTTVIIDPHGEYTSMKMPAEHTESMKRFNVSPKGYRSMIMEFSPDTKINPEARPLRFTLRNLDAREILGLTNLKSVRSNLLALRRALDILKNSGKEYNLSDIIAILESQDDPSNSSLMNELEYLREVEIFAREGTRIDELITKGSTSIINLKGAPPDIQELIVNRLATALFELRKVNDIPPLMLVIEEAHNFCPQQGQAASSKVLRTIASEGRKFGLGLLVLSQRAAKIDKNVLSQCNTQIILKLTNPNDLKAVVASVEGLTSGMTDEIQRLSIGVALVVGGNITSPLFVEVRPRESEHGGQSVKVISG
ncbi:MAG: ATP-binding protein [Thermoplasmata archaeon]